MEDLQSIHSVLFKIRCLRKGDLDNCGVLVMSICTSQVLTVTLDWHWPVGLNSAVPKRLDFKIFCGKSITRESRKKQTNAPQQEESVGGTCVGVQSQPWPTSWGGTCTLCGRDGLCIKKKDNRGKEEREEGRGPVPSLGRAEEKKMRSHIQPVFTCYPYNNLHFSVIHISTPSSDTYSLLLLPFRDQGAYNLIFQIFFRGQSNLQLHVKSEDELPLSCCITC